MLYIVIAFLWLSIWLYLILGGADFGAGIIELFTSQRNKERTRAITYHAIGPVWEANHMWLIIAIVILFVGFPTIYTTISTYLHIPLLLMLLGITARGTAFVFRHYDAVKDEMQGVYNKIFVYSSFITPLFLGMIAGSVISGKINPEATDFYSAYLLPWLNLYCFSIGLFTVSICGFLAAVFLVGEAEEEQVQKDYVRKAYIFNITTVLLGGLVFLLSEREAYSLFDLLLDNALALAAITLAGLSLPLLWNALKNRKTLPSRLMAGFQVSMILGALGYAYFPDFVVFKNGEHLSLLLNSAPDKTLTALGWALMLGSLFILPALGYLFFLFQKKETH